MILMIPTKASRIPCGLKNGPGGAGAASARCKMTATRATRQKMKNIWFLAIFDLIDLTLLWLKLMSWWYFYSSYFALLYSSIEKLFWICLILIRRSTCSRSRKPRSQNSRTWTRKNAKLSEKNDNKLTNRKTFQWTECFNQMLPRTI